MGAIDDSWHRVREPRLELVKRPGGDVVYPQKDGGRDTGREQKQLERLMAEEEAENQIRKALG